MLSSIPFIPLLSGSVFIVAGFILFKFPPKNINGLYGYRTGSSMKSQDRWDFAQVYAGKEMMKLGIVLVLLSFVGSLLAPEIRSHSMVGLLLIIASAGALITSVQRALKQKFGDD